MVGRPLRAQIDLGPFLNQDVMSSLPRLSGIGTLYHDQFHSILTASLVGYYYYYYYYYHY